MSFTEGKYWRIKDEYPNEDLSDIYPLSSRAKTLISRRNDHQNLDGTFTHVFGAVEMMNGLDYHYDAYSTNKQRVHYQDIILLHDITAYFNRMGQFNSFCNSKFVYEALGSGSELIPTITKFMKIRNKATAHRAIDAPRKEDSMVMQLNNSLIFSSLTGATRKAKDGSLSVSIQLKENASDTIITFSLEHEHETIMNECYHVISQLLG